MRLKLPIRIFSVLLCLGLSFVTSGAWAACTFDLDAFTTALVRGDETRAKTIIATAAARSDCGCETPDTPCLRLGPEGSDALTVKQATGLTKSMLRYKKMLASTCGSMPEANQSQRTAKLSCLEGKSEEAAKYSAPEVSFLTEKIAKAIGGEQAGTVLKELSKIRIKQMEAAADSPARRKAIRIEQIAEKTCEKLTERGVLSERVSNIARQRQTRSSLHDQRLKQVEYMLKGVREDIVRLKQEFEAVSGRSFYSLEWCIE
jgi:hypothetical protein